ADHSDHMKRTVDSQRIVGNELSILERLQPNPGETLKPECVGPLLRRLPIHPRGRLQQLAPRNFETLVRPLWKLQALDFLGLSQRDEIRWNLDLKRSGPRLDRPLSRRSDFRGLFAIGERLAQR